MLTAAEQEGLLPLNGSKLIKEETALITAKSKKLILHI